MRSAGGTIHAVRSSHWRIGHITITRVDSTNFVLPSHRRLPAWAVPAFTPSTNQSPIAFSALVVRTPKTAIVIDPWLVDDGPRSRPDANEVVEALLSEVAVVGAPPEIIETVVLSHLDGIGWCTRPTAEGWRPAFPNARYLLPSAELAAIDRGDPINGAEHLGPLRDAGVLHPVDAPFELAPGIHLIDAAGHNAGHHAVRIESGSSLAIYAGHLVLSLLQVDDPDDDIGDSDITNAALTRRRILSELADRDGVLLTTLIGGPGGGIVSRNGTGFRLTT